MKKVLWRFFESNNFEWRYREMDILVMVLAFVLFGVLAFGAYYISRHS